MGAPASIFTSQECSRAPSTQYAIRQINTSAGHSSRGPELNFQTGAVTYSIPTYHVGTAPNGSTATAESVLLMSFKSVRDNPPLYPPVATDLIGRVLWYYWDPESPISPSGEYLTRPVDGGTFLILMWGGAIREVDLAGNIVHETNVSRISAQVPAFGTPFVGWLSHEARRLPNGHTVTLGSTEQILTNLQGLGGVDVGGDVIIDLDQNFQVTWFWNSFSHLNTARPAVLGEQCGQVSQAVDSCGTLRLGAVANDWTHANSLLLTSDGNLLISLRNQDYVIKLAYQNGAGSGDVIYTLGKDGACATPNCTSPAFTIDFVNDWPWFSHQHDVEFDGVSYELYDNGNTRIPLRSSETS